MKVTVTFEGGKELVEALGTLSQRMSKRVMRDALDAAAEPMRRRMSQLAPREPGAPDLAANIVVSTARPRAWASPTAVAVAVGPEKQFFYGFFQEYGTAFHGAQPFMRPAFDEGVPRVITELTRALWTALAAKGVSQTVTTSAPVQSSGRLT